MAWTYNNAPGTSSATGRRDAVRWLVGDTDTSDQQVTDEEVTFALSEAGDNVYSAAALVARGIAGKYARLVDNSFETVDTSYSDRQKHYQQLATKLEQEARSRGGRLGTPVAGGISIDTMDSVEDDSDRPDPAFTRRQHRNPPDDIGDEDSFQEFHNL